MRIEGEHLFAGPREKVWELVRDPEVLATCLPGTQKLEQVSDTEYEGQMHIRIGPVSGLFSGRIVVSDEAPPERCTLSVEGRGAPGFAKGSGQVQLFEQDDETTRMQYEGEMQIGGRLASVGQRLIDTASKSMIRQGLESLNEALQAHTEAETRGEEVAYQAPTEAQFAQAVARDMARELFASRQWKQLAMALAVVAGAMVVGYWLGRRRAGSA
jgi:carbon monoxide dehydrogenase subunit G